MKVKSRGIFIATVFWIGLFFGFFYRSFFVMKSDDIAQLDKKFGSSPINLNLKDVGACKPQRNIVFLKTHKTGGSTVQNILLRYGQHHNLIVGLPQKGFRFAYSEGSKFHRKLLYPSKKSVNMLCHHMRFDKQQIASLMPSNTMYITILREPGSLFVSYFDYFHDSCSPFISVPQTTDGLKHFLNNSQKYLVANGNQLSWFAKNGMFHDLGFNHFKDDDDYIRRAIMEMDDTYHLVLLSDYFEESMILMKDLLCMSFNDIQHLRLNSRLNSKIDADESTRQKIRKWNKADTAVYRHFNESFWRKVDAYGRERMRRDVDELKHFNLKLQSKCIEGNRVSSSLVNNKEYRVYNPKGVEMAGFILKDSVRNNKFCQNVVKTEVAWYKYLMKVQYNVIIK